MRVMSEAQNKSADLLDPCLWRSRNPMVGQGCRHQSLHLRGYFILLEKVSLELILCVQGILMLAEFRSSVSTLQLYGYGCNTGHGDMDVALPLMILDRKCRHSAPLEMGQATQRCGRDT